MALRLGKGDLCGIILQNESAYGVEDSTASKVHAGVMSHLEVPDNTTFGEVVVCGSRTGGTPYIDKRDPVGKVRFNVGKNVDWSMWTDWILGGASMAGGNPSSKRFYGKFADNKAEILEGAMLNSLTISSSELGGKIDFEAEIFARLHRQSSPPSVAISNQSPLRSRESWTIGGTEIKSGEWSLKISQDLQKVAGAYGDITLASGEEPYLGDSPEITLEITVPAESWTMYDTRRLEDTVGKYPAVLILGSKKITLTDAYITGDTPARESGQYTDTLVWKAKNITISSVGA